MEYQNYVGEITRPFDEEWDFDWETGGEVASVNKAKKGREWQDKDLVWDDDLGELAVEDEYALLDEELPCEMEEVLEGNDKYFVEHLRRAEALVKGVAVHRENHFEVIQGKQGRLKIFRSLHGQELLKLVRKGCDLRCSQLSVVDQNPYVGVYHRVVSKWNVELMKMAGYGVLEGGVTRTVEIMNEIVNDLRREVGVPVIKSFAKRADRAAKARGRKAVAIIDKCFQHRSRLLVLRVDLGYRKGRFIDSPDFSKDLEEVKQHWAALSKAMKQGLVVPNVMEVFGKLEYGVLSGFHFHVVIIMKGAEHQEDISYAKMVGQYWLQEVVDYDGRYFNCNRIKRRYKNLGIGEINYYEKDKVDALKGVVIDYVVKSDYYMNPLSPSKKTFLQLSCTKPRSGGNRGRPRRYLSQE